MTRISEKEALRLGIKPAAPAKGGPATPARMTAREFAAPKRVSKKGGRIPGATVQAGLDIRVDIPFEPKTKQRARTSLSKPAILNAFYKAGGSAEVFRRMLEGIKHNTYTPDDTAAFEHAVAVLGGSAMRGRPPYEGPLYLDIVFTLKGEAGAWPTDTTDPDLDNMEKALLDALNGVVWKDDRLIVGKTARKVCGPHPSIALRVRDASSAFG